jgi:hypothetical protein
MMSVGLGSLISGVPKPSEFLSDRFELISCYIRVLSAIRFDFSQAQASELAGSIKGQTDDLIATESQMRQGFEDLREAVTKNENRAAALAAEIGRYYDRMQNAISVISERVGRKIETHTAEGSNMVAAFVRSLSDGAPRNER